MKGLGVELEGGRRTVILQNNFTSCLCGPAGPPCKCVNFLISVSSFFLCLILSLFFSAFIFLCVSLLLMSFLALPFVILWCFQLIDWIHATSPDYSWRGRGGTDADTLRQRGIDSVFGSFLKEVQWNITSNVWCICCE